MEEKVTQLLIRLESPLAWCKSELEDFLGEEVYDNNLYRDLIHAMNLKREIESELKENVKKKYSSKKFKQKQLFDEN